MTNFQKIIFLSFVMHGLSSSAMAADEAPDWAEGLPYGTLTCGETTSHGVDWRDGRYVSAKFMKKNYSISRLTRTQSAENSNFCKTEDRVGASMMGKDKYWYQACYRFDNALSMLGSAQGWCTELYQRGRPTQVSCEFSEPSLAFTPSGEFIAYGRTYNIMAREQPYIPSTFTSHGRCGEFSNTQPKPLGKFK